MNFKYIYICVCIFVFFGGKSFAQVKTGINTRDPKATLHVQETSKEAPTGRDGILIPRVENLPDKGVKKGQLIFLMNNATIEDDFYYWDGEVWDKLVHHYNRMVDEAIYVFTGEGYGDYKELGAPRAVFLDKISAALNNDFSVKDNVVKVNKKGTYLVFFTSNVKIPDYDKPMFQTEYITRMYKNNKEKVLENVGSTPNKSPSALNITLGGIVSVNDGDELSLTVERDEVEKKVPWIYEPYGVNSLALYFLYD